MPKFCCRHCGCITDNPNIESVGGTNLKYNYLITCPVCLKNTYFWRDKPFPTDKLKSK